MPTLLVIQHVPHERLGTFEPAFKEAGCSCRVLNAHDAKAAWPGAADVDGIVSMGGPRSVSQQKQHPYLTRELEFLREALALEKPILGVCLGAQLLAAALGAKVTKNPQPAPAGARGGSGKEIGWYPLMREPGAEDDPLFAPFGPTETVFQWHGDTFALPKGAVRLASSPLCREQAFRYGDRAYGLQFHVEVTEAIVRAWMQTPANKTELASLRGIIDPMTIRRQSPQHAARLAELSRHVATTFAELTEAAPHARSR